MPHFSGLDFARAVREISPGTAMAITSGSITDELRKEGERAGVRGILFKPDFGDELCDAVGDLIEEVQRAAWGSQARGPAAPEPRHFSGPHGPALLQG